MKNEEIIVALIGVGATIAAAFIKAHKKSGENQKILSGCLHI